MDPPFTGAGAFTDIKPSKIDFFMATSNATLFLDEIEALPPAAFGQVAPLIEDKRLRRVGAVPAHSVDVKLVVAMPAGMSSHDATVESPPT